MDASVTLSFVQRQMFILKAIITCSDFTEKNEMILKTVKRTVKRTVIFCNQQY